MKNDSKLWKPISWFLTWLGTLIIVISLINENLHTAAYIGPILLSTSIILRTTIEFNEGIIFIPSNHIKIEDGKYQFIFGFIIKIIFGLVILSLLPVWRN